MILVQEHRRRGDARRVVMFAVFFVVATLSLLESKQMGIGLAVPRRSSGPCCYPRR